MSKEDFKGLVVQVTGLDAKNAVVALICRTFEALKSLADFEQKLGNQAVDETSNSLSEDVPPSKPSGDGEVDLRLSYTINLVLPKSDDPAVFSAIFRALREHLLRK